MFRLAVVLALGAMSLCGALSERSSARNLVRAASAKNPKVAPTAPSAPSASTKEENSTSATGSNGFGFGSGAPGTGGGGGFGANGGSGSGGGAGTALGGAGGGVGVSDGAMAAGSGCTTGSCGGGNARGAGQPPTAATSSADGSNGFGFGSGSPGTGGGGGFGANGGGGTGGGGGDKKGGTGGGAGASTDSTSSGSGVTESSAGGGAVFGKGAQPSPAPVLPSHSQKPRALEGTHQTTSAAPGKQASTTTTTTTLNTSDYNPEGNPSQQKHQPEIPATAPPKPYASPKSRSAPYNNDPNSAAPAKPYEPVPTATRAPTHKETPTVVPVGDKPYKPLPTAMPVGQYKQAPTAVPAPVKPHESAQPAVAAKGRHHTAPTAVSSDPNTSGATAPTEPYTPAVPTKTQAVQTPAPYSRPKKAAAPTAVPLYKPSKGRKTGYTHTTTDTNTGGKPMSNTTPIVTAVPQPGTNPAGNAARPTNSRSNCDKIYIDNATSGKKQVLNCTGADLPEIAVIPSHDESKCYVKKERCCPVERGCGYDCHSKWNKVCDKSGSNCKYLESQRCFPKICVQEKCSQVAGPEPTPRPISTTNWNIVVTKE